MDIETPYPTTDTGQSKRLYRSRTDRMIGGVAGGVAEYFGVDSALIRLIAVVLAVTGPGVLIYIVMWIVVPEAPLDHEPAPVGRHRVSSDDTRRIAGAALILLGAWLLAQRWMPWIDEIFWPALLVVLGAGVLIYGARR
jgi:phage shock protein C